MKDFKTQDLNTTAWAFMTIGQPLDRDSIFSAERQPILDKKKHSLPKSHEELVEAMPPCKIIKSDQDPSFTRLCDLQGGAGKLKHSEFVFAGDRLIEAALDAGWPVSEI
eukprot:gnl/MRDRNA2_/MRDRNA2_30343_c0_seq1.p4 gnl/MRDRNA2_/MRDRNA2_30343_c0~~gnl/MRDRNA2_/MRDRNA2_30343_c0_seq1.p4  ORF type:complete len:109 (+),score=27.99 gnl/MRDRNA2_/MRDRNA2_30343_c0_seq1:416-742(+)